MTTQAKYADGGSVLPQPRTTVPISWAWASGASGAIAVGQFVVPSSSASSTRNKKMWARTFA